MRSRLLAGCAILIGLASLLPAVTAGSSVNLKSELLSLSQLPKHWVAASAEDPELPGCNATAFPTNHTTLASTTFDYGALKGFPQIVEVLAIYENVDKAFDSLAAGLNDCKNAKGSKNGKPFATTVSKLAFSSYGDQSAAYQGSVRFSGFSFAVDVLIVRKGKVLLELQEGNTSTVSTSAFHGLATTAVRKL